MSLHYLPPVKPSAIVIGTVYQNLTTALVYGPFLGPKWHKAIKNDNPLQQQDVNREEAAKGAASYVSSVVGAGLQTYAIAALIQLSGTFSYKAAAYLGGLIVVAQSVPTVINGLLIDTSRIEHTVAAVVADVVQTVGLTLVLTWHGTRRLD